MFRHSSETRLGQVAPIDATLNMQTSLVKKPGLHERSTVFKKFDLSLLQTLKLTFCSHFGCCFSRKEKAMQKILAMGEKKVSKALDIQNIIQD